MVFQSLFQQLQLQQQSTTLREARVLQAQVHDEHAIISLQNIITSRKALTL